MLFSPLFGAMMQTMVVTCPCRWPLQRKINSPMRRFVGILCANILLQIETSAVSGLCLLNAPP